VAVASWVRRRPEAVAWLSLERTEDRPERLATYIVATIRRAVPEVGAGALASLQDPRVDIATDVIGSLTNDLAAARRPLRLVLDDYHVIRDHACHELIATLLADLPPGMGLVIITRADPPLPLGRLRASGELAEVRADDLRFDADEIRTFMNDRVGRSLDVEEIGLLEERTEGWPAALSLANLSMASEEDPGPFIRAFTGSSRHIVDYLVSEVLDAQLPDMRHWLLLTAPLGRVCGDLADVVTGLPGGRARLAELERSNLFLGRLGGDGDWYRFHRMFRQAMRTVVEREEPGASAEVLVKAAVWHESQDSLGEAIRYAIEADDHDLAGRMLARHYLAFTRGGHLGELRELIDALDSGRLRESRGAVAFVAAIAAGLYGEGAGVVDAHLDVVEAEGFGACVPDLIPSQEAAILFVRAAYLFDDVRRQQSAGSQLVEDWPDIPVLEGVARMALGYVAYLQGDHRTALAALRSFGDTVDDRRFLISIFALSARALAKVDAGQVGGGMRDAQEAYAATLMIGSRDAVATAIAHQAMGAAMLAEARPEDALPFLEKAVYLTHRTQPLQRASALLTLASARSAVGDTEGALGCVGEASSLLDGCRDPAALPARLRRIEATILHAASAPGSDGMPSAAELRVLRLLASSLSQREIANELYLSPDTVKSHVRHLYRKLGVATRGEAVERARGSGLL
jgi:LuxR family maltose regulon positive regulatory protein